MEIVCLGLGLMILIAVNIVLGSLSAIFQNEFCPIKLRQGIIKAGIVAICFAATYLVGFLNPNIVAVEVNGVQVSVKTGIDLVVLVGYYHYAKQVLEKLTDIIKGDMFVSEIQLFNGRKKKNGTDPKEQKNDLPGSVTSAVDIDPLPEECGSEPDLPAEPAPVKTDQGMNIVIHLFVYDMEGENKSMQSMQSDPKPEQQE